MWATRTRVLIEGRSPPSSPIWDARQLLSGHVICCLLTWLKLTVNLNLNMGPGQLTATGRTHTHTLCKWNLNRVHCCRDSSIVCCGCCSCCCCWARRLSCLFKNWFVVIYMPHYLSKICVLGPMSVRIKHYHCQCRHVPCLIIVSRSTDKTDEAERGERVWRRVLSLSRIQFVSVNDSLVDVAFGLTFIMLYAIFCCQAAHFYWHFLHWTENPQLIWKQQVARLSVCLPALLPDERRLSM